MKDFWKSLFLVAAMGNCAGGLMALVFPDFFLNQQFSNAPAFSGAFALIHVIFWGFVVVMGLGSWLVWRNQQANGVVALLGGLGKLLAVVCWLVFGMQGGAGWLLWAGAGWDGLLGILFLYWYFKIHQH